MRVIDISPPIGSKIAVFPGDTSFRRDILLSFQLGNHLELSAVQMSVHTGAHADAPSHFHPEGRSIDKIPLDVYIGRAQVITVNDLEVKRLPDIQAKRVLFRTNSFPNPNRWNDDFFSLTPEIVEHLHSKGVILVGIDTPSVDPADSKDLPTHQALFKTGILNLEGLDLSGANDGIYNLVALPIKIEGAEAAWVRAVLVPLNEAWS